MLILQKGRQLRHALLSCSVVSDSWTLGNCMDCSPPGSSVHGDSPSENTGEGGHASLQGIFPTQGLNPCFPHCRWILYHLSQQGSPLVFPHITCLFRVVLVSEVKVTQSCPTLCDPMDYTVHGIPRPEQLPRSVAVPFSRRSSQPRDRSQVSHIAGRFFTS